MHHRGRLTAATVLAALIFTLTFGARAATQDYYVHRDEKIPLARLEDRAFVQFDRDVDVAAVKAFAARLGPKATVLEDLSRQNKNAWMIRLPGGETVAATRSAMGGAPGKAPAKVFPVYRYEPNGMTVMLLDEIAVRLQPGADERQTRRLIEKTGLRLVRKDPLAPDCWLLQASGADGDGILKTANALALQKRFFQWAQPNFYSDVRKSYLPNDPLFPNQWHLNNTGQGGGTPGADVGAAQAWDTTRGDASIVIAIVDDGLDLEHQDLAANLWTNPGEVLDGLDNDGNGYVDDVNGWDFCDNDNDPRHYDNVEEGHGTSSAGIAAAVADNGEGVSGLAPGVRVFMCKIFKGKNYCGDAGAAAAIRYAGKYADVMSNSWGGGAPSAAIEDALIESRRDGRGGKGCVVFAASGNDYASAVSYPAAFPWLQAVGATDRYDARFDYSNYGPGLSFCAPSGNWTTDIRGLGTGYDGESSGDYTDSFGGTSSATPLAAGAAALILSYNPELRCDQVAALLAATAEKVGGAGVYNAAGYAREFGYGRIDVAAALNATPSAGVIAVDDHLEENDTRATAAPVEAGRYKGLIAADEDWYSIAATAGNELSVTIDFLHAQHDLALELVDASGALLAASNGALNGETVDFVTPAGDAQTYYMRVYAPVYGYHGYTLDVRIRPPDDALEENDSPETAAPVDFDSYSNLQCYDDDWYRLDVSTEIGLSLLLEFSHAAGDLDVVVYDQDGAEIGDADSATDNETVDVYKAPGRTAYLIHVYGWAGAENSYSMTLSELTGEGPADDSFEENDSFESAAPIALGNHESLECFDPDYYRVEVADGKGLDVEIRFTHADGDLDLRVEDLNRTEVGYSGSTSDNENLEIPAVAGRTVYVVQVYGYDDAENSYAMTLSENSLEPLQDDPYEENDTMQSAASLGSSHHRGLVSLDPDWYLIPVADGQGIEASISFSHATSDLDLELFNAAGETVDFSYGFDDEESVSDTGAAGNTAYFLLVDNYGGTPNLYDMIISVGGVVPPTPTPSPTPIATPTPTPPLPTPDPNGILGLIDSFYQIILDRSPSSSERNGWLGYFNYAVAMDVDVRFVAREMGRVFFLSAEYDALAVDDAGFLSDCYNAFLQRNPTQEELDGWLAGEWNRPQVMTLFAESGEFEQLILAMYPNLPGDPTRNFVTTLYIGLLDRLVDEGGLTYFSDDMNAAADKRERAKQMVRTIVSSMEFQTPSPTNDVYVVRLYRALLGRFPSDSERDYWAGLLASGATTTDAMIDQFGDSAEFSAILAEYFGAP